MDLLRIAWRVALMVTWVFAIYGVVIAGVIAGRLMELPSYMLNGGEHVPGIALGVLWLAAVAGVYFFGRKACRNFMELLTMNL
ncbi:hypothetical protein A3A05_02685 [Candidatus Nomurabacteria bacterium RIFCSPLOWO2_01_FULL_41_12]|uniref:Uncharacterized protein n=1 Tax=Candidatus Nomurabacteria bacterium RIFCSPLOWO2_01_FULL_41_12 TaxID=1801774 RepID=A0A1F6WW00_9BACT|nr:MAG: hypothetical protein A2732_00835 [Candidatus Nomurabacteria bacterium RIFCSPHIGHO2_01_FULL_40_10]OGI85994.1 MAG: hypothetical protein A3A05_02685 [Candidatus Nomurabacteria bacterium RIFCSPLOWO2_01_FULL_41_12]